MAHRKQTKTPSTIETPEVLWPGLNLEPLFANGWYERLLAAKPATLAHTPQERPVRRAA